MKCPVLRFPNKNQSMYNHAEHAVALSIIATIIVSRKECSGTSEQYSLIGRESKKSRHAVKEHTFSIADRGSKYLRTR